MNETETVIFIHDRHHAAYRIIDTDCIELMHPLMVQDVI